MEAEQIAHLGGWRLDVATGHVSWSPELFALFGLDPAGPVPDYPDQQRLMTPESWQRLSAAVAQAQAAGTPYELELEIVRADGSRAWAEARGEAIRDANGTIVELHGVSLDITDRKAARDELRALATHDPLTGLANRAELLEEVTRAVSASERSGRSTAILMMDLDRFKAVNDTLGHAAGDELLVIAAARLNEVVRAGDLVARLGGDEFVIVMRELPDPSEAVRAAGRLVHAFQAPFIVGDRELFATASVGVAIATATARAGDLLREADTAMYAAKEAGRDRVSMFNEDLRTAVATRMTIEADLRHALERGELAVWYQPEVDLSSGAVVALEALLRWFHPDGSVWTADRFVDVAEETGLILDIGDWVLRQACVQGAAWAAARPDRPVTVRVNVSALQLAETGLIEAVDDALGASGLDPALMCVEITETALLRRTTTTAANLAALHARGISLAIDDFGTGYASLTYLSQYPIDVIKIDRSFITEAAGPDDGLVAGIIALATTLDITVTAEGVEHLDPGDPPPADGVPVRAGLAVLRGRARRRRRGTARPHLPASLTPRGPPEYGTQVPSFDSGSGRDPIDPDFAGLFRPDEDLPAPAEDDEPHFEPIVDPVVDPRDEAAEHEAVEDCPRRRRTGPWSRSAPVGAAAARHRAAGPDRRHRSTVPQPGRRRPRRGRARPGVRPRRTAAHARAPGRDRPPRRRAGHADDARSTATRSRRSPMDGTEPSRGRCRPPWPPPPRHRSRAIGRAASPVARSTSSSSA